LTDHPTWDAYIAALKAVKNHTRCMPERTGRT
jgi:hypothetical protein